MKKIHDYEFISDEEMRRRIEELLEEWIDEFGLSNDDLIIVARHYKWNKVRMNNWFNPEE